MPSSQEADTKPERSGVDRCVGVSKNPYTNVCQPGQEL